MINESHLQVGSKGIRQAHVAWECTEDEIAHLNATWRDDIAEAKMVVAQKLRKVVKQHEKYTQSSFVQQTYLHSRLNKTYA